MVDLELRKTRIGGTGAAAILGVNDFLSAFGVWKRMKGPPDPEPEPENIRAVIGQKLERGLLDVYAYMTNRQVEHCDRSFAHPTLPYAMATPDGFCTAEKRGVDLKVVQWDQVRKFGDSADEIPYRMVIQADWYMAFFDFDVWDVCCYLGTGVPRIYTLHRDRESEAALLKHVEEWHARFILGDEIPPLDTSYEAKQWLQQVYPEHKRPDIREADEYEARVLDEYLRVRVLQKNLKGRQDELETRIKAAIRDREGLEWGTGRFTWRRTKDGQETDWKSLATGLLYGLITDQQQRDEKLAEYTHPKPGYRKIRIDHPALKAAKEEEVTA